MTAMQGRSYFGEYAIHKRQRGGRFHKLMKSSTMIRSWIRFIFLSLFVIVMLLPTPASTTHLDDTQDGMGTRGNSVMPIDAMPPFHHMGDSPSLAGNPDYEFVTTKPPSGDLLTVAIVNEVLWNQVPVGQIDRQWVPSVNTTAKR